MLSAPASIPATIALIFPCGFDPTEVDRWTFSATIAGRSHDSASRITGSKPAHDTRFGSSKTGAPPDHPCCSFTLSAFWIQINQDFSTPDSSVLKGTSTSDPSGYPLPIHGSRLSLDPWMGSG